MDRTQGAPGANRPKVAVLMPEEVRGRIFPASVQAQLAEFAEPVLLPDDMLFAGRVEPYLEGITAVITGWKGPRLTDVLAPQGSIAYVSHAAGSIRLLGITHALAEGRIRVSHSATAIGEAVAEFTLAQILAHLRLHRRMDAEMRAGADWFPLRHTVLGGLMRMQKVGLVGMGYIGRMVRELLRPFRCEVLVYDPFLGAAEAERLGVTLCSLEDLFRDCPIVSLHAPNIEATHGMIRKAHFDMMQDGALVVNTARAGIIEEGAMLAALQERRIFAALDVFDDEPVPDDDPLLKLPNVYLTPHCAGHTRESYVLQGTNAVEDMRRYFAGEPLLQEIPSDKAHQMA
jgi:phosphoglycerate dehydrogenase-like enzyme